jgi:integrase/recombinase XerD
MHDNNIELFIRWCENNGVKPNSATLNQLYNFNDYNKERGASLGSQRAIRRSLFLYNQFLGRKVNPAMLLKIVSAERKLPNGLLDNESLINIYVSVIAKTPTQKRNKVMLGLVLFQAVRRNELEHIELHHIEFDKKRIYIPSTNFTNERYVPLLEFQMQDLQSFVYELRPQLLIEAHKNTSKLFFSQGIGNYLSNAVFLMSKEIKVIVPYFRSFSHCQQSRVSIWLKEHGLRQTQYLSGMKYATSVDRYKTTNTDSLMEKLKIVHPMDQLGI